MIVVFLINCSQNACSVRYQTCCNIELKISTTPTHKPRLLGTNSKMCFCYSFLTTNSRMFLLHLADYQQQDVFLLQFADYQKQDMFLSLFADYQ